MYSLTIPLFGFELHLTICTQSSCSIDLICVFQSVHDGCCFRNAWIGNGDSLFVILDILSGEYNVHILMACWCMQCYIRIVADGVGLYVVFHH